MELLEEPIGGEPAGRLNTKATTYVANVLSFRLEKLRKP
jgi:hypothetical protein